MYRVLIADDEVKVCRLIENIIDWDSLGLEVVGVAHDGLEALSCMEELKPDIVITDIRMPGVDGLQLIEKAKELDEEMCFIIISGHRQFDYARNAMRFGVEDYLLKPLNEDELIEILKKLIHKKENRKKNQTREADLHKLIEADSRRMRHTFMEYLIGDSMKLPLPLDIDTINQEYFCNFKESIFQVIIVKADISEKKENEEAYQLLITQVQKLTENELRPGIIELLSYPSREGIYFLINMDESYEKSLRERLKRVRTRICTLRDLFRDIKATVCMGIATKSFSEIPESAKGARSAVFNRIFIGLNHTIGVNSCHCNCLTVKHIVSSQIKTDIQRRVEVLDTEEIPKLLTLVYQNVKQQEEMDGELLFAACIDLVDTLLFSLKKMSTEIPVQHIKETFLNQFCMCMNVEEVFRLLTSSFEDSMNKIADLKAQTETKPIRIAKKYIQDHYYEAIKLEDISVMLGFNPSYFSGLFKKETGENFSEYLTQIRINQAKQLLIQETIGIEDIAEEVGYKDLKYFSKLFKRLTGLNPTEFRKLYRKLD